MSSLSPHPRTGSAAGAAVEMTRKKDTRTWKREPSVAKRHTPRRVQSIEKVGGEAVDCYVCRVVDGTVTREVSVSARLRRERG